MTQTELLSTIGNKEVNKEEIIRWIINKPELISEIYGGLSSSKANIKYGCSKILRGISDIKPDVLYPKFNLFSDLLTGDNTFLKWDAIYIIANLTKVDSENKFESIFDKYFAPIPGPVMITAANIIGSAATIALAKPELTGKITKEILKVEKAKYKTAECLNIAFGQSINSFDQFFSQLHNKEQ
ncbi:MAG: hypothetical protein PHE15_03560, partial [Dehalococcoidales bacterium]|nr:hypothetical protein [Dehalococcoidales bacterium]